MADIAAQQSTTAARRWVVGHAWPEAGAAIVLFVSWLVLARIPVGHDVVWDIWIARQLLGGTELYTGIVEVNPPLWYWMAMPIQWASDVSGIGATHLMVAAVFAYMAGSLALMALLLRDEAPAKRAILLLAMIGLMVVAPIASFAQREHLCLIAAFPYLTLIARRAEGRAVAWPLALAAGAFAAPAFALKHYFVLAPLALEAWLLWEQRLGWKLIRPELMALVAGAVVYGLAVLVFTPQYLTVMVPMLAAAYGDYGKALVDFLREPYIWVWAASAVVLVLYRARMSMLTRAAIVAAIAYAAVFVLQHKWWDYHNVPLSGTLGFALATLMVSRGAWNRDNWVGSVAAAGTVAITLMIGVIQGPYVNLGAPYVSRMLSAAKPGQPIMMLTTNPSLIWPMVEDDGYVWPSRYFGFWMVPALNAADVANNGTLPPKLEAIADRVRAETVEDFLCHPPQVVLVDERPIAPGGRTMDFLSESADFRELFSHYMRTGFSIAFTIYQLVTPLPSPPAGTRCTTIR